MMLSFALLGTANMHHFLFPINVAQTEMAHFTATKPIDCQQQ
jgi:hypothetical protein